MSPKGTVTASERYANPDDLLIAPETRQFVLNIPDSITLPHGFVSVCAH